MKNKVPLKVLFNFVFLTVILTTYAFSQTPVEYTISFNNAIQHEAEIEAHFDNLENKVLEIRMSRTSPGRYALHEFAKNVYNVRAYDGQGEELPVTRPNPHQWNISGHDGAVVFKYTLFANRGGGTYSQVDETHAHLNIPATFAFARGYDHRPVMVTFNLREDLNWKVATQLKHVEGNTYYAPDGYYFMDSPTEIADLHFREEELGGQNIRLALHTPATDAEVDTYFEKVMAIVKAQREVYGQLPDFDYGEYTFLSCYMPNASGDGMEHRNSTYVVSSKPIDRPLGETSIGTISHEFFHAWNVERMRPASLEPFNFEEANMSGELWFAEGFTSYYTGLILARAGIRTDKEYIEGLDGTLNYVINSPGRRFFNPIEMSYQAPFVDAARSVDPVNRNNTFISYYSYGSVLGLALDLSLRRMDSGLNLDDFMKKVWEHYGATEVPYTVRDLQAILRDYAGRDFADDFFNHFVFDSRMPDYKQLLADFGVRFERRNEQQPWIGTALQQYGNEWKLSDNALIGSPVYEAGINEADVFTSFAGRSMSAVDDFRELLNQFKPGDEVEVVIDRFGQNITKTIRIGADPAYQTQIDDRAGRAAVQRRNEWISN